MLAELTICAAAALWAADQDTKAQGTEPPATAHIELIAIEKNIVDYTNAERRRHGLPELTVDPDLVRSARRHAQWMTRNRLLQHTRIGVAENIAMGYPHSREAVRGWMGSSGHRANILSRAFRRIGVAAYRTQGGKIYWCQQFRH
jgi:uncharacterized protein YkwD